MANGVYGGPTWRNTQNLLGSGWGNSGIGGANERTSPLGGVWNAIRPPAVPWPSGVPYTNYQDRGAYDATQGQGDYRGGSRWPVTHPYGQAPVAGSVWSSTPRALPWLNQDNPLALNYGGGYSPSPAPVTQQPPAVTAPSNVQASANVPADVQRAGLSNWYLRFMEQHGGQTPEDFYRTSGYRREGLSEALADLDWSKGFQQMYGRPPSEDDWKAWYFQSRGGGNYGERELWRAVKGASDKEYRRMLARATTKEERNKIKRYRAAVKAKGMTPEQYYASPTSAPGGGTVMPGVTGPVNGVAPAPGYISAEEAERVAGDPSYGAFPVMVSPDGYQLQRPARAPLFAPPQTYWQLG